MANFFYGKYGVLIATCSACFLLASADNLRAAEVGFDYTAELSTVTGMPFGLDPAVVRALVVPGSYRYDTTVPDTEPADTVRGKYPHTTGGGAFSVMLPGGVEVTGSGMPYVEVNDNLASTTDEFRYRDGPGALNPVGASMSVDGVVDPFVSLDFVIVDGTQNALTSDALPDPYPFTTPPIAWSLVFPHTFNLQDLDDPSDPADTVGGILFQFIEVDAVSTPGGPGPGPGGPSVAPEPTTGAMLMLSLLMICTRQRRQRNRISN